MASFRNACPGDGQLTGNGLRPPVLRGLAMPGLACSVRERWARTGWRASIRRSGRHELAHLFVGMQFAAETHTPESLASWTTACAASATSGNSSSGKLIAPSSNEIRYRVTSWLLVPASSGRLFPCDERLAPEPTGYRPRRRVARQVAPG